MGPILEWVADQELRQLEAGQVVIEQGGHSDCLHVLVDGTVEVLRDGIRVAMASEPGAMFGEMAALLRGAHTATVRTVTPCTFRVVPRAMEFLQTSPVLCFHICELLARRLDSLNRYLVDVRRQFAGHDHISMVDGALEVLMSRPPRTRIRPRESTIHHGELPQ